ncbi:MAG: PAS domain-containing protein, partial [Spirochaetes bacterium]|nr:PAS domain-containing protein [Spirochaetota bacterium]
MNHKNKVLIVEKDKNLNQLLQNSLRNSGFSSDIAVTGQEALADLSREAYELIIMDYSLPDYEGLEFINKLEKEKIKVPFVMINGNHDEKLAVNIMKHGAHDYFIKDKDFLEHIPEILTKLINEVEKEKENRLKNITNRQKLATDILEFLNQATDIDSIVNYIMEKIKNNFHFHSIGVRLKEGDDYPYFSTIGFPEEFIKKEYHLCPDQQMNSKFQDKPILGGFCGKVIQGNIDHNQTNFTEGGSFWTNNLENYIQQSHLSKSAISGNSCYKFGYQSIALIPLKSGQKNIGLLQINDKRANMFDSDLIQYLEKISYSIGITLDRNRKELLIKKKEIFANQILNSSLNGMYIYDFEKQNNIYINTQYTKILGYSLEDLNSMSEDHILNLFHPDDIQSIFQHMEQLKTADDNEVFEIEYRFKKANGEWCWCCSRDSVFLRNKEGEVKQFIGTFLDMTERKDLEQQLLHSQKMEAIGTLAGGIAHDFNNLLTIIKSYSEFVMNNLAEEDDLREDVEEIYNAGIRAANLTRQLLLFSRKQPLKPTCINLNELIINLEKMLNRLIGANIQLNTKLSPDLYHIYADAGQMEQVIMNLVVNALDAMPKGGE